MKGNFTGKQNSGNLNKQSEQLQLKVLGGEGNVAVSEVARAQTELGLCGEKGGWWGSQGHVLHNPAGHLGDVGLACKCLN